MSDISLQPKYLQSEIINQKKQLIFKVEQTVNQAFPNEDYKYYLYIKNISGVPIENIHIKVNHPNEVIFNEEYDDEGYINIGTLESEDVKFIYLKANCQATGKHYVHFICYGDGTGLYYKSLVLRCSYAHTSDELIHRIHIYDFTPYEDTYMMNIKNFNEQTTQLFKTQKLPFKAGEQPFAMETKDSESSIRPFSNVEQESFIHQNDILKNTKEHVYQYISRENFNENSVESYEGKNLRDIIDKINQHSKIFKAKFLKTGTNQLRTDLRQYEPNGFLYRFGLLNSEIYHYLGTLPTYTYMSDYLFRWAPDGREPLNLYPQKIAMHWNTKKWAGRGYIVYKIATKEYMASDDFTSDIPRWEQLGRFIDKRSAESCVERELFLDEIEKNQTQRSYDKFRYKTQESYFDTGVFYIHIPIDKIPSNFYLLDTIQLEALIQRAKPFGTKPLIRYMVERTFDNHMEFMHYPIFKPYTEIDMSDIDYIPYFIQSKKYQLIKEQCGNKTIQYYGLKPSGLTTIYNYPFDDEMTFEPKELKPTVYIADKKQELINKNVTNCKGNQTCIDYVKNKRYYPDNTLNNEIEQYVNIDSTYIDNDLGKLKGVGNILYQNNFDNIAFSLPSTGFKALTIKSEEETDYQGSIIKSWMENHDYHATSFQIERIINKTSDYYILSNKDRKANAFKIPINARDKLNKDGGDVGIGVIDKYNKYHIFSLSRNQIYNEDYLQYATVYNNNFKLKKDALSNADALVIRFIQIDSDYRNTVVLFLVEKNDGLHYFHHIVCPNLSEIFIFLSKSLTYEKKYKTQTCRRKDSNGNYIDNEPIEFTVYEDEFGNELPCGKKRYTIEDENGQKHIKMGTPSEIIIDHPEDIRKHFLYASTTVENITFETPFYNEIDTYETTLVQGGENWTNLYRINKAENSYTYIQNKTNEIAPADDIVLHFDDINIPDRAQIKSLKLRTILSSSHSKEIYSDVSYQNNYVINDAKGLSVKLSSNNIECYHQTKESQYYYYRQLEDTNNKKTIKYLNNLITENILFDESLDFNDEMKIKNPYWIETTQFTEIPYDCNNIDTIEFVIEGFNYGPSVNILSQLLYEKDFSSVVSNKIDNGYFFTKINLPFANKFLIDWLRLRFRFEDLNDTIEIFDYYLNITFKEKQKYNIEYENTDSIINIDKNIKYFDLLKEDTTAPELNNGITVNLSFDDLEPGEQYRIYSNELEIEYKNPDMNLLINYNKFFTDNNEKFITITGEIEDSYLSGSFYTDKNCMSQIYSDVGPDNLGVELRDTVYQAFSIPDDNITAIQIYPNGFQGSPDASLKLGIYENRGTTPGKLIKEVYANGWGKSNVALKNLNSIKYEINVDGLTPHKLYWFKLEVETPSENNFYLLKYTSTQRGDYKLLLKENNNYINISGSLEFSIYSKDLTNGFSTLPTMQDYLPNPYVEIGLHRGQGTIKNLAVKKKMNDGEKSIHNEVIFNGQF